MRSADFDFCILLIMRKTELSTKKNCMNGSTEMNQPRSLFQSCLNFVSKNLSYVDSLVGFPDSIGKKIFDVAFEKSNINTFQSTKGLQNNMLVFFDAYGSEVLHSLCLRNKALFLNETVDDCWWLYRHLKCLDLTQCGIRENHDILSLLLSATYQLETLIMRRNLMTDEAVRKLTLNKRLFTESKSPLKNLDLSENVSVTVKSLDHLKCFSQLAVVDMSQTSVTEESLRTSSEWRLSSTITDNPNCSCARANLEVTTGGWAAASVLAWQDQLRDRAAQKNHRQRTWANLSFQADGQLSFTKTFYPQPKNIGIKGNESGHLGRLKIHGESGGSVTKGNLLLLHATLFSCSHRISVANSQLLKDRKIERKELCSSLKVFKSFESKSPSVNDTTCFYNQDNLKHTVDNVSVKNQFKTRFFTEDDQMKSRTNDRGLHSGSVTCSESKSVCSSTNIQSILTIGQPGNRKKSSKMVLKQRESENVPNITSSEDQQLILAQYVRPDQSPVRKKPKLSLLDYL